MEKKPSKPERCCDIDFLRIIGVLTVFLVHCARIFDLWDFPVKNNRLYPGMSIFVNFLVQWMMPLLFIVSGTSAYYSLSFRTPRQYIYERFKRLIIPLIFGVFVLIPPIVYLERMSHLQFSGSFIEFYPVYFDGLYGFGGNFAWMGMHLWYLLFLFIFSVITLKLFIYLTGVLRFAKHL